MQVMKCGDVYRCGELIFVVDALWVDPVKALRVDGCQFPNDEGVHAEICVLHKHHSEDRYRRRGLRVLMLADGSIWTAQTAREALARVDPNLRWPQMMPWPKGRTQWSVGDVEPLNKRLHEHREAVDEYRLKVA